eukprot:s1934_g10.t1
MPSSWRCDVCASRAPPKHGTAAAPGLRPYSFNRQHSVDLKYFQDSRRKLYVALSMLDAGTLFHQAVLLKTPRSESLSISGGVRVATGEELGLQSPMPEQDLKDLARILKELEGKRGFRMTSMRLPPKPPLPRMPASRQLLGAQGQAMMRGLRSAKLLLKALPPPRHNCSEKPKYDRRRAAACGSEREAPTARCCPKSFGSTCA